MDQGYFPLRLITCNTYQLPWLSSVYNRLFQVPGSADREVRFTNLCNNLNSYCDIACLQECHNELIVDRLAGFSVKGVDKPPDGKIARVARSYYYQSSTGGLVTAIRNDINIIWSYVYKFTYCADEETLNRSISFTLLDMKSYWSGKYLLICNLHLYGGPAHVDNIVREQQRNEIYGQLLQIHKKKLFPLGFTWNQCGVLICGCFNAAASSGLEPTLEYRKILESFGKTRDLLCTTSRAMSALTYDPDNNSCANKSRKADASRMDFILALDTIVCERGTTPTLPLTAESAEVLNNLIVSDHYAVYASVYPRDSPIDDSNMLEYGQQMHSSQFPLLKQPSYPTAPPYPYQEYAAPPLNPYYSQQYAQGSISDMTYNSQILGQSQTSGAQLSAKNESKKAIDKKRMFITM